MAISYTTIDIAGTDREAIVLSGTDDARDVIFRDYLTDRDEAIFEAINDLVDGEDITTFKQSFDAYVIPKSNRVASVVYAGYIKNVGDFVAAVQAQQAEVLSKAEILQLQADYAAALVTIADLQDQIDALENP